jgi:hypothetical protein
MTPENDIDTGIDADFDAKVEAALHPKGPQDLPEKPKPGEKPFIVIKDYVDPGPHTCASTTGDQCDVCFGPVPKVEDKRINFKDELRPSTWSEFEERVLEARKVPEKHYVPPVPTERQRTQTELEMEAGRKRVALAEAQKIIRVPGSAVPSADEIKSLGSNTRMPMLGEYQHETDVTKAR